MNRPAFIREAQGAGLTLAQIRSVLDLRDSGEAPCGHVAQLIDEHLDRIERRMAELRTSRALLRDLGQRAAETDAGSCPEGDICTILRRQ
ncbi:MerR family DNA-binding protein [Streptomyces sp. NPDC001970]